MVKKNKKLNIVRTEHNFSMKFLTYASDDTF